MLREVLEDTLRRGEKLKRDIVGQVLSSAALSDLIHSKHFAETIAKVIQTKGEISALLRRNVHEVLKMMSIPSREQIATYERRVQKLEHQIDQLGRQFMRKGLKKRRK